MIRFFCSRCGNQIEAEESREFIFCTRCGSRETVFRGFPNRMPQQAYPTQEMSRQQPLNVNQSPMNGTAQAETVQETQTEVQEETAQESQAEVQEETTQEAQAETQEEAVQETQTETQEETAQDSQTEAKEETARANTETQSAAPENNTQPQYTPTQNNQPPYQAPNQQQFQAPNQQYRQNPQQNTAFYPVPNAQQPQYNPAPNQQYNQQQLNPGGYAPQAPNKPNININFTCTVLSITMDVTFCTTNQKFLFTNGQSLNYTLMPGQHMLIFRIGNRIYNRSVIISPEIDSIRIYASWNGRAHINIQQIFKSSAFQPAYQPGYYAPNPYAPPVQPQYQAPNQQQYQAPNQKYQAPNQQQYPAPNQQSAPGADLPAYMQQQIQPPAPRNNPNANQAPNNPQYQNPQNGYRQNYNPQNPYQPGGYNPYNQPAGGAQQNNAPVNNPNSDGTEGN